MRASLRVLLLGLLMTAVCSTLSCGGGGGATSQQVVIPPPPPPVITLAVDAGPDQNLALPDVLEAAGFIDTNSTKALSYTWSVESGPGEAQFLDESARQTRVTFSEPGLYGLRLSVTDGDVEDSDGFRVQVAALQGIRIELEPLVIFQTLTGWEATATAGQVNAEEAFDQFDDELFDTAVEDGINRVRLEIRAGAENTVDYWTQWRNGDIPYQTWRDNRYATINDDDHPLSLNRGGFIFSELDDTIEKVVLPLANRLRAVGEDLFVNVCYVAVTGQIVAGLDYHHDDPDEYAEFVLAVYQHLDETWGFIPDSFEIVLEPDNQSYWNGTYIGEAMVAAGARLTTAGYEPAFVAPSCTNMSNAISYFDALVAVPGATEHLKTLSYHRYGGVSLGNLNALRARANSFGLETAHLEFITATYETLHEDLKIGGNSAWSQYALVSTADIGDIGAAYYVVDDNDPDSPVLSTGSRTEFLKQYFRFLPAGSTRIGASTSNPGFDPLVFIREDDGHVVVVKSVVGGDFHITGLPAGEYGVRYTTPDEIGGHPGDVELIPGEILTTSIPRDGVVTIFAK